MGFLFARISGFHELSDSNCTRGIRAMLRDRFRPVEGWDFKIHEGGILCNASIEYVRTTHNSTRREVAVALVTLELSHPKSKRCTYIRGEYFFQLWIEEWDDNDKRFYTRKQLIGKRAHNFAQLQESFEAQRTLLDALVAQERYDTSAQS